MVYAGRQAGTDDRFGPAAGQPGGPVRIDGSGRLWVAGDGLWVVEPGGKSLQSLAALPMVGSPFITAFSLDPNRPNGVIVSLWNRGVVFIRLDKAG